jgi:hypothetical protein
MAELVIAVADLLEAEGRSLRRSAVRTGWGLGLVTVASVLLLAGLVLCLAALYDALAAQLGSVAAKLGTGLAGLALAGVAAWLAGRVSR